MEKRTQRTPHTVREFSAGGVVFKKEGAKILWLVTKSSPSKIVPSSYWRLPKGKLDDENGDKSGPLARGEKKASENQIQDVALKEVREEGGVRAKIIEKIGTQKYFFTFQGEKILKFVTFYLMEWEKDLAEGTSFETEEVAWLPHDKAKELLKYNGEKETLDKAKVVLESGTQGVLI